jgi:hypothetical protein
MEPKYIKVNGVTKLNPKYKNPMKSSLAPKEEINALPVYTSREEYENQMKLFGQEPKLSESSQATELMFQDSDIQKLVGSSDLTNDLSTLMGKYEIPFGMVNKLMELQTFEGMLFMIDDSGSMNNQTDTFIGGRAVTRWEETRLRLLEMIEILAYVPTPPITIVFLNRSDALKLDRTPGHTPQQFLTEMTSQINRAFHNGPNGSTPYLRRMEQVFQRYSGTRVVWYFFSDGVPDGGKTAQSRIQQLCMTRANPEGNPITFFSCTNEDDQVEWMKTAEEVAPFCAEFDDYNDEKGEVLKDQGLGIPFTKGFYIIGCLVAAMNPNDLDAMDESVPFTKPMLDNLLGFVSDETDYQSYFNQFIRAQQIRPVEEQTDRMKREMNWFPHYRSFLTAEAHSEIPAACEFKQHLKQAAGNAFGGQSNYGQGQMSYGQPQYGQNQAPYGQSPYGQPQYNPSYNYPYQQKKRKDDCIIQ